MGTPKKEQFFKASEGRSKRRLQRITALVLGMVMLGLTACGSSEAAAEPASPYAVKIGDKEVKPGETTVQELADAGYDFSDLSGREMSYDENGELTILFTQVFDLSSETEALTVYPSVTVVKDSQQAALISVCNESEENAPLSECIISSVTVYSNYWEADKAAFEGIAMESISDEALTEVIGEPKRVSDNKDKYTWERGLYTLELKYREDGTIESVRSNFNEFAS